MSTQTKEAKGWDYFAYALYAFAGLGIEVLLAFFLEPLIYGCSMNEWSTAQNISHWIITCICWGIMCAVLINTAKSKYKESDIFTKYLPSGEVSVIKKVIISKSPFLNLSFLLFHWQMISPHGFLINCPQSVH